jgi:RNA polymerase sigma-70 factor (ECF subfamily)
MDVTTEQICKQRPYLLKQALRITHGRLEPAEDLVQDTLLTAIRFIDKFDDRCRVTTWLNAILLRKWCDTLRRERRQPTEILESDAPPELRDVLDQVFGNSAEPFEEGLHSPDILQAIRTLGFRDQDIVLKIDVGGMKYEEYAKATGVQIGTVKSRLNRARTALREKLSPCLN